MDTEALKKSLLKKFQEVTADRLQKIQLGVIDLEKPTAAAAADEVARELHTMKGEARMLGLAAIGQLAHAAEDVLKASREGKTPTSAATDLLLRACDAIADLLEDLPAAQGGTPASQEMAKALAEAAGTGAHEAAPAAAPVAASRPAPAARARRSPRAGEPGVAPARAADRPRRGRRGPEGRARRPPRRTAASG